MRGTAGLIFAQTVLSAGAANVVLTLWRIDDAGAAAFATRFYQALRDGDAMAALKAAQRATAADQRWQSPYYWAGYVLAGDGLMWGNSLRRGRSASAGGAAAVPRSAAAIDRTGAQRVR